MSPTDSAEEDRPSPVDAVYVRNLDALTRDLDDIEALAAAALAGESIGQGLRRVEEFSSGLTYEEITAYDYERRELEPWGEAEITDLLDPAALKQIDDWRMSQRVSWNRSDFAVVGVAGLVGALANLYDSQIDATVLDGLAWLKKSDLLLQWEKESARLPIDYTGPKFGGPAHRVRSAGHDIGRFFNALEQVRSGSFEGVWWEDGQKFVEQVTTTRSGKDFAQASDPNLALALLLKHWAADFVTPMGLPLPGWSLLYEMPNRDLRKFAHDAYAGSNAGDGLNLRSGVLTPGLGMVATEVIIRTQVHLAAYSETGNPLLSPAASAKRTEMLLAAHAVAGAASLSKTAAAALGGGSAVAVRHLNVPVLTRVGMLALKVHREAVIRESAGAPSWGELLESEAATWTMPEAIAIADLLTDTGHVVLPLVGARRRTRLGP